jgi:hypothetical protein
VEKQGFTGVKFKVAGSKAVFHGGSIQGWQLGWAGLQD